MNNTNRIQNDVAVQYLVRRSMAQAGLGPLIPSIYAWAPPATTTSDDAAADEQSFGWIMSEFRSGVDLDSEFSSLEFEDKKQVLEQVAAILSAIQAAKLPEDIKFGGLAFDSKGQIVSGEAPLRKGEPKDSYAELKLGNLNKRLEIAAKSPVIQGWKYNGVITRIEKFLASGGLLTGVDVHHKGLMHGDFTMNNMLFDKNTKRITAVLDFDWSSVSHPFDEFVSGLHDIGGNIAHENKKIEAAILSGDFSTSPNDLDEESTRPWEVAKAWNMAMKKTGVLSLSDIEGVDQMLDILRLQGLVSPFRLCNASMLEKIGEEEKVELRAKAEADLIEWLEKYGF